jgi:electron transfer flavoprotein alpha subunit
MGTGPDLEAACQEAAAFYETVWRIEEESLSYPDAELIRVLLTRILPADAVLFVPHEHFGMDLAPGLSVKRDVPFVSDVVDFEGVENGLLKLVRQEYNGQVSTHVGCSISGGAVMTLRPGSFEAAEGRTETGRIQDKSSEALEGGVPPTRRRFIEVVEAEKGDVDITRSETLVSVGRGIEDQDNLDIIHELAEAMGADVSCSRPVVDANWLEKARQVGTSGQTVKPKVYMALGISGAFQHLAGIKGSPFMVAINKNPKAPIFQVADVGVVGDVLDLVPELTDGIKKLKG